MIKSNRALVLRNCRPDMTSHNGFKWPKKGKVTAPDWSPEPKCGNGLHGLLWGEGPTINFYKHDGAKWLVVSIEKGSHVNLGGKVKFQSGYVVYCGKRIGAVKYIQDRCEGKMVVYGTAVTGAYGTAIAGYGGTAMAGSCGTAKVGTRGTAIAGDEGTAIAGSYGIATVGAYGETAKAGYDGIAIARGGGTVIARGGETAMAGEKGIISIHYFDGRRRIKIGYIGEDGLLPNVVYCLNAEHEFEEKA